MDTSLLNIGIGAVIYIVYRITGALQSKWRLVLFVLTGMGTAALFQQLGFSDMGPALLFPVWIAMISGGIAGALLYWAQTVQLFTQSSMKYSATILVSIAHTLILFGVMILMELSRSADLILVDRTAIAILPLILYSLVSILGFSLPLRILK